MKILHVCLSCFYIDDYAYQENILPIKNQSDGHEVKIIASTETFVDNLKIGYVEPKFYKTNTGIAIDRLPYDKILTDFISHKVRKHNEFENKLKEFKPDVILFHGMCGWELLTVAKYKKNNPNVKFYVDSHADFYTSGTNWLSKNILHGIFYKTIIHQCFKYIDKIFYISINCGEFVEKVYNIPKDKCEFYPLGGVISSEEVKEKDRIKIRELLNFDEDIIMCLHAGKLDEYKKTVELLETFNKTKDNKLRLVILGSLSPTIQTKVEEIIKNDNRIIYKGFVKAEELIQYLHACDLYIQPGKVSAIAQNAISCACPVILKNIPDYEPFCKDNGWLISQITEIKEILLLISEDKSILKKMSKISNRIAREKLDYKVLAQRLYR